MAKNDRFQRFDGMVFDWTELFEMSVLSAKMFQEGYFLMYVDKSEVNMKLKYYWTGKPGLPK